MLNKKLVLAALLGAAVADTTGTETTGTETTGTETTGTETTGTETTGTETTGTETTDEKEDEEKEEGLSRVWKEEMPDGSTTMVLCDQGESALWEDAKAKLVKLAADKASTAEAFTTAESEYNTAEGLRATAASDLATFNLAAAPYETKLEEATTLVTTLQEAGTATISLTSTAAQNILTPLTQATTAAEEKVDAQLARVEGLLTAMRTQQLEEATWEERKEASEAAATALNTALSAANDEVTMLGEQLTTRSYLFQMYGTGSTLGAANANWAAGCAFGYNESLYAANNALTQYYTCGMIEQSTGSSETASTWAWTDCYSGNAQGTGTTGTQCKILGLNDDPSTATGVSATDGLISYVTTQVGTAKTSGAAATGLYLTFQGVDLNYFDAAASQTNTDTKHNQAIAAYLAWQKKHLLSEYLKIAAWVDDTDGSTTWKVQASDYDTQVILDSLTYTSGNKSWQPFLNSAGYQATAKADADTARKTFDSYDPTLHSGVGGWDAGTTPKHLTPTTIKAAAAALVDVWFGEWIKGAFAAELANVGADTSAGKQATAAAAVVTATAARDANLANTAAMVRWKEMAAAEVAAIEGDIGRARVLLTALTQEIAPVARAESDARANLAAALAAEATKDAANVELGTAASSSTADDATGAYAIKDAAQTAVDSIVEQRKYHQGRLDFYTQVLEPLTTIKNDAETARDNASAAYDVGLALLNSLRDQCKKQAFTFAQERLQKQLDDASKAAATIESVATAYGDLSAFPPAPAVGALCNYPKDSGDAQPKRPDCGKELCCGAAQRFLADGTKLSIETCQDPATTVYTYYPALPANALVAPTEETWRFQCISAAGRLATSVAAVLATGYMLA